MPGSKSTGWYWCWRTACSESGHVCAVDSCKYQFIACTVWGFSGFLWGDCVSDLQRVGVGLVRPVVDDQTRPLPAGRGQAGGNLLPAIPTAQSATSCRVTPLHPSRRICGLECTRVSLWPVAIWHTPARAPAQPGRPPQPQTPAPEITPFISNLKTLCSA